MNLNANRPVTRLGWIVWFCCICLTGRLSAQDLSVSNLLTTGELHEKNGETPDALKAYEAADKLSPNNTDILDRLAKMYCDSMQTAPDKAAKKALAEKALACALSGLKASPESPKAHVCVAVCYAKNFPFSNNQTKVNYSREVKAEAEKAIALDPKFDIAYHMLGRWNYEVANMNFFVKGLVRLAYGGLPKASNQMAIDNFKKAIELAPDRIIHHLQLARMYHITSQEPLVPDELKKSVTLTPIDKDDKAAQDTAKKLLAGGSWPDEI